MNDDERFASLETNIAHILATVSDMRADLKGMAATYISRQTFDAIYESARREIEGKMDALHAEHARACAEMERRANGADAKAGQAADAVAKLAEKYEARAWSIFAKIIGAAILAGVSFFAGFGTAGPPAAAPRYIQTTGGK